MDGWMNGIEFGEVRLMVPRRGEERGPVAQ